MLFRSQLVTRYAEIKHDAVDGIDSQFVEDFRYIPEISLHENMSARGISQAFRCRCNGIAVLVKTNDRRLSCQLISQSSGMTAAAEGTVDVNAAGISY